MIPKHLTTRVSVIAIAAGFSAACGSSGDVGEQTSEETAGLSVVSTTPKVTAKPALPTPLPTTTVKPIPTTLPQPPISGTIPADASAPIGCATFDQNVQLPDGVSGSLAQENTWFDGIVSFRFDASVPPGSNAETAILDAIRHYNFMTSVRFVFDANDTQSDHVVFQTTESGCFSRGIGFQGGSHVVNLQTGGCDVFDVAVHEIGHRVGLHHEQRRADRDQYILIQDGGIHDGVQTNNNIQSDKKSQFDIYQGPGYQVGGFDFDSVMLYPAMTGATTFAIDTSKPIITRRDGTIYPNPQTGGLSPGDTATLFQLYPPPALVANTDNTCRTAPIKHSTLPVSTTALSPKQSELIAISNSGGTAAFAEFPSSGSAFGTGSSWGAAGGFQSHNQWAAGDFNKDGLTDIAEIQNSLGLNRIVVRTAHGGGLNAGKTWADRAGKFEHARQWLPGDYDKDGRDDLAVVWRDGSATTLTVLRSNGTSFKAPEHWSLQTSSWDWNARWTVGDFNNDGRADIAAIWNDAGFNTITAWISTGSSFSQQQWATRKGTFDYFAKWLAGDFDGNGSSDLVMIRKNGTATLTDVFGSTGSAFAAPVQWLSFVPAVTGTFTTGTFSTGTLATATLATAALATYSATAPTATTTSNTTLSLAKQIGTGPDTLPPVVVVDPDPPAVDVSRWTAGDFDDDGRVDLAAVWDNGGTNVITVLKSTGSSFTSSNWSTAAGSYQYSTQWCAGRFRDALSGGVATQ